MSALRIMTTISAWILFILGLAAIAWGVADLSYLTGDWELTTLAAISCGIGMASLALAGVVAWLMHKMESET